MWAPEELFMNNPGYELGVKLFVRIRISAVLSMKPNYMKKGFEKLKKNACEGRTALSKSYRGIIQLRRRTLWYCVTQVM